MVKKVNMVPPDGGWGWIIVLGVAIVNAVNQSLLSIYGLLFGEKLTQMGEDTVGAALVGNIMLVMINLSGLISGPSLKRYSTRRISIIGTLLSAFGLIASGFATKMWHLIATYSIFTGLGIGLLQPSTFLAVNEYFVKKRGRAVGIAMAGTGIGQMLMPHLVRYLLDNYSFSGCATILGGLALNGVVGAALFQPVKWHLVPEKEEHQPLLARKDSVKDVPETGQEVDEMETTFGSTNVLIPEEKETPVVHAFEKRPIGCWTKISNFFDLDLLTDCVFVNITIGCALGFTSNQSFNMFFPFFLQQQVGMSRPDTAMCMSALAAADIVARLTIPALTDRFGIASRSSYFVACIVLTGARMALTSQTEYTWLLVASAMNGFSRSPIIVNQSLMISEHMKKGDPKLPTALGINMVTKGFVVITLGQLVGWVRDYTGSYIQCINAQNALLVGIVVLWTFEHLFCHCKGKR